MAEQNKETNEQYRRARDEFDALKIEEKAIFMVEAAFSMLAQGIESIGNLFSEQVNKVYEDQAEEEKEQKDPKSKNETAGKKTPRKRSTTSRTKKETDD
jgi:hypothetical protein